MESQQFFCLAELGPGVAETPVTAHLECRLARPLHTFLPHRLLLQLVPYLPCFFLPFHLYTSGQVVTSCSSHSVSSAPVCCVCHWFCAPTQHHHDWVPDSIKHHASPHALCLGSPPAHFHILCHLSAFHLCCLSVLPSADGVAFLHCSIILNALAPQRLVSMPLLLTPPVPHVHEEAAAEERQRQGSSDLKVGAEQWQPRAHCQGQQIRCGGAGAVQRAAQQGLSGRMWMEKELVV